MAQDAPLLLEWITTPPAASSALSSLPKLLTDWFGQRFGTPTLAQRLVWPAVIAGQHLLVQAPTGSGKTLAAFLPILGQLAHEPFSAGIRCLYIAPLKALTADIRKNLRRYWYDIGSRTAGGRLPLRISVRTGDTPPRQRRRLRDHPPDILLTTPESLAVLLSQPALAELFRSLRWVVMDELHSLAGNKRGADLALSLERLTWLAGESLQRIGLSATCAPVEEVARFLAGADRPCRLAAVSDATPFQLDIEPVPVLDKGFLTALTDRLLPEVAANRTTLIFTNARGLAERLARALRRRRPDWTDTIAVHHSALSRQRRRWVERRLKQGRMRVVVSSTSLELGVDIGSVDGVVLVHPPGGAVRLLQRLGRSGHAPGQPRRGLVLTSSAAELLEATVTGASSMSAQWESVRIPAAPLDVLCQQLLGLAAQGAWTPIEAFTLARRAYPYRNLSEPDFTACLDYLSGVNTEGRDWLPARLRWQRERFTIADARTARLLRRNLGTIRAEEPRGVQLLLNGGVDGPTLHIGQVDDRYADRLQPGARFLLDGRCLQLRRIEPQRILVEETIGNPAPPRWHGSGWPLSADLARRLYVLRCQAAEALRDGPDALVRLLAQDYGLPPPACDMLSRYFQSQECISEIPEPTTCLIEAVRSAYHIDYYVHTPLNRLGNDALARVVVRRLVRDLGRSALALPADLGFQVSVSGMKEVTPEQWRQLLAARHLDSDLTAALRDSLALRERFRQVALIGLMVLRHPLGGRRRVGGADWVERRLFEVIHASEPDFVLLRQARAEVRHEVCDLTAARQFSNELPRLRLQLRWLAEVSPFAASWTQLADPVTPHDHPTPKLTPTA